MTHLYDKIVHATINPCQDERRIFSEALTAARNGYRVEIFALKIPDIEETTVLSDIIIQRIPVKYWRGGPLKFITFNWKLFWKLLGEDFSILHVHDLWVLPATAVVSIFKKCKLVYDSHEFARGLEIFQQKHLSGKVWALTEKLLIKRVDVVLTINSYHKQLFLETYPRIPEPEVIMNFPSRRSILNYNNLPKFQGRRNIVLYQGIFKNHRGLKQLIKAMVNVNSGSLELIGSGEIENSLRELVKILGINDKVIFRGRINWDQLLTQSSNAKAGLVLFEPVGLNYQYASPNKFFEYVMAGTPVIVSNIIPFQDFISSYEVGILVDLASEDSIALAIEKLLTDEKNWLKYHQNCLKAREVWNWELQEQKLIDLYLINTENKE